MYNVCAANTGEKQGGMIRGLREMKCGENEWEKIFSKRYETLSTVTVRSGDHSRSLSCG